MSKLNRNEFKELLTEWVGVLNNNLLLEISKNEVIEVIGEDDYNTLVTSNRKASQDQNFLQVIINTYNSNQNHSIEDILGLYQNYTRFIAPSWNRGEEAKVDVPGGHRATLTPDSTTYDDMLKFVDASSSLILKSKAYIKCLKQGPVNADFEVIINDSDWIICYPKTIRGSISLARSFWNGSELEYDRSVSGGVGKMIGKMIWCTSVVSGGNMFLNYHRKLNLHMYYCIKKSMNIKNNHRKLCISFAKKNNRVTLMKGHASVDGNNRSTSEKEFRNYIGERFYTLFRDAEKPERLEIDEKEYYESISLEQYKILRAASEDNLQNFYSELHGILSYSRDKDEIILNGCHDKSPIIRRTVVIYVKKIKDENIKKSVIEKLSVDEDNKVIKSFADDSICFNILTRDYYDNYIKNNIAFKAFISNRGNLFLLKDGEYIIQDIGSTLVNNDELYSHGLYGYCFKNFINNKSYLEVLNKKDPKRYKRLFEKSFTKNIESLDELKKSIKILNYYKKENDDFYYELLKDIDVYTSYKFLESLKESEEGSKEFAFYQLFNFYKEKDEINVNSVSKNYNPYGDYGSVASLFNVFNTQGNNLNFYKNNVYFIKLVNESFEWALEKINSNIEKDDFLIYVMKFAISSSECLNNKNKRKLKLFKVKSFSDLEEKININKSSKIKFSELTNRMMILIDNLSYDRKYLNKAKKIIINNISQGYRLNKFKMYKFIYYFSKISTFNSREQSILSTSLAKTDYDSQYFFLKYPEVTKKVYLYMIRETLHLKGRGPSKVHTRLPYCETTYKMLENPTISKEFVKLAQKSLLSNIVKKIIRTLEHDEESEFNISKKAMVSFYTALINSEKGMSIKKNRKNLEKILRKENLIENKYSEISDLLENYIKKVLY